MSPTDIVQKLWYYCNVLHDDGMSYGDYVEQLTYLLFLKMADECTNGNRGQSKVSGPADLRTAWRAARAQPPRFMAQLRAGFRRLGPEIRKAMNAVIDQTRR
jgi:hypothetical protein